MATDLPEPVVRRPEDAACARDRRSPARRRWSCRSAMASLCLEAEKSSQASNSRQNTICAALIGQFDADALRPAPPRRGPRPPTWSARMSSARPMTREIWMRGGLQLVEPSPPGRAHVDDLAAHPEKIVQNAFQNAGVLFQRVLRNLGSDGRLLGFGRAVLRSGSSRLWEGAPLPCGLSRDWRAWGWRREPARRAAAGAAATARGVGVLEPSRRSLLGRGPKQNPRRLEIGSRRSADVRRARLEAEVRWNRAPGSLRSRNRRPPPSRAKPRGRKALTVRPKCSKSAQRNQRSSGSPAASRRLVFIAATACWRRACSRESSRISGLAFQAVAGAQVSANIARRSPTAHRASARRLPPTMTRQRQNGVATTPPSPSARPAIRDRKAATRPSPRRTRQSAKTEAQRKALDGRGENSNRNQARRSGSSAARWRRRSLMNRSATTAPGSPSRLCTPGVGGLVERGVSRRTR